MFGIRYTIPVIFCHINVIFEIMIFFLINSSKHTAADNWLMTLRLFFFNVINKLYPVHLIEIVLNRLQLIKISTDLYSREPIFVN